jgi:hypothetical protein
MGDEHQFAGRNILRPYENVYPFLFEKGHYAQHRLYFTITMQGKMARFKYVQDAPLVAN